MESYLVKSVREREEDFFETKNGYFYIHHCLARISIASVNITGYLRPYGIQGVIGK